MCAKRCMRSDTVWSMVNGWLDPASITVMLKMRETVSSCSGQRGGHGGENRKTLFRSPLMKTLALRIFLCLFVSPSVSLSLSLSLCPSIVTDLLRDAQQARVVVCGGVPLHRHLDKIWRWNKQGLRAQSARESESERESVCVCLCVCVCAWCDHAPSLHVWPTT